MSRVLRGRSGLAAEQTYAAQVAALEKAAGDLMNQWDLWKLGVDVAAVAPVGHLN